MSAPYHVVTDPGGHGRPGEAGSVLILTAMAMTMLLALLAFSFSASFAYDKRNVLYAAADAAAKSAAFQVRLHPTANLSELTSFANRAVRETGLEPAACGTSVVGQAAVCISWPPVTGLYVGKPEYVEVVVSQRTDTFFGSMLGAAFLLPGARAVAGPSDAVHCIITTGFDFHIGSTTLTMNGCGVASTRDAYGDSGGATIRGLPLPQVSAYRNCPSNCGGLGDLQTRAPAPVDPFANLAPYSSPSGANCPGGAVGNAPSLAPGCYTSITAAVQTLQPGEYYITGPVNVDGGLSGDNVFLYLTGPTAQFTSTAGAQLHLTAPTSGPYDGGIAIFYNGSMSPFNMAGDFVLDLKGAVYVPGTFVSFPNSMTINPSTCTVLVLYALQIDNGTGTLSSSSCLADFPTARFHSVTVAE